MEGSESFIMKQKTKVLLRITFLQKIFIIRTHTERMTEQRERSFTNSFEIATTMPTVLV